MESKNRTLGIIIGISVAILIGVVLVGIIADQAANKTQLKTQTDTVNIATSRIAGGHLNGTTKLYSNTILTYPVGDNWKSDYSECAISSVIYKNQSGSIMTDPTDYVWVEDGNGALGWLRVQDSVSMNSSGNSTTITYNYCPKEYVTSGWGKTIFNLIPGFFALALFIAAAFVIYTVLKSEGVNLE